jgi:hypothetical protein
MNYNCSYLDKILVNSNESYNIASFPIKDYIDKYKNNQELLIVDYRFRARNQTEMIPQIFNNNLIFISSNSFQQNHKVLKTKIRKYVMELLNNFKPQTILCIGGESYLYGLMCQIPKITHYTNSKSIYLDSLFNSKLFSSQISNNLINYNIITFNKCFDYGVINLANLCSNLLKQINNLNIQKIIIINCHHNDFWKKIKLLSNYKIINRQYFVCDKLRYFLTVSILKKI